MASVGLGASKQEPRSYPWEGARRSQSDDPPSARAVPDPNHIQALQSKWGQRCGAFQHSEGSGLALLVAGVAATSCRVSKTRCRRTNANVQATPGALDSALANWGHLHGQAARALSEGEAAAIM